MKNSGTNRFILTAVFALAMGSLEAIVAWYLRLLYYPSGFSFPIVNMPGVVLSAEMVREAATIVMIAAVASLSGNNKIQRASMFFFLFGIWDICYYLGLKILTGWPNSLFTWDILFLIPFPWTAPVLAPLICSVLFTASGGIIFILNYRGIEIKPGWKEILLFIAGIFIILFTFLSDFLSVIGKVVSATGFSERAGSDIAVAISRFVPAKYNWGLFAAGAGMLVVSLSLLIRRTITHNRCQRQQCK